MNQTDKVTFKLLSEKVFLELIKSILSNGGNVNPELIAHLACDLARQYINKRDAMLDFSPGE